MMIIACYADLAAHEPSSHMLSPHPLHGHVSCCVQRDKHPQSTLICCSDVHLQASARSGCCCGVVIFHHDCSSCIPCKGFSGCRTRSFGSMEPMHCQISCAWHQAWSAALTPNRACMELPSTASVSMQTRQSGPKELPGTQPIASRSRLLCGPWWLWYASKVLPLSIYKDRLGLQAGIDLAAGGSWTDYLLP